MEGPRGAPQPYFNVGLEEKFRVVPAMPEEMRPGPDPHGAPWELVVCAVIGFFTVFFFVWKSVQCVRSRLYLRREKKLVLELSELIEEKCKLLDKVSLLEKEYNDLEASLKDANSEKESKEQQISEAINEMLNRCKSNLGDKIRFLEKDLIEEKSKHSEQDELLAETSQRIKSLEDESKSLKSQIAEAKTTLRTFQMNKEGLKGAIKEALNENSQLQARQKHLFEEAEAWKKKVSDLNKEKVTFEYSKVHVEQVLRDKDNHIKSLTERVLKMREWAPLLREDLTGDGNLELEVKTESEIGADLDDPRKRALKKLVYAAKLNTSLKTLEGERDQISTLVSEVGETNKDHIQQIENLQAELASLKSENTQSENEKQQLQQKLEVMVEEYQESELKLYRRLRAEEKCPLEEERRLSEVEKKISHATEQLETYREQAKGLEEELKRTDCFYQRQIMSYEKKAHDNALVAWAADRNLKYLRQANAQSRQKLAELEFQFQLLEQDPHALGASNIAFGREHAPHQATGSGFVFPPLAPIRGPLPPVDAGIQFMGRGPFLPPPPSRNMYGASRDDFPPGTPLPPFPMQNVHSLRRSPDYLPPSAGFFPATHAI